MPFKSLRFQPSREQRWGINITRQVQHSGQEDSWAPARRASASFLAQSGHLVGLADLQRGLVLDFNPSLTSKTTGSRAAAGWDYNGGSPELGGSIRWGITNNLNLNGTANPDFSQVESDAGQFQFDPRDELFFSEKRPFFLDGSEQFTTPNQLIYTRRIVQPVAAVKLTGKGLGTDIGFLSAVDDKAVSVSGDHPVYNLLRLQRDIGANSRLGMVYTDRVEGSNSNRVGGIDGRLVKGVYSAQFQVAGSRTTTAGITRTAPLYYGRFIASGRTFGFRATINGSDTDFRARSGFFPRPGFSHANFQPRVSFYGPSGSLLENLTVDRQPRRLVSLRPVRHERGHAGGEGPPQCQPHHARRLARGRVRAHRAFRLPVGGLHRLPPGAAECGGWGRTRSDSSGGEKIPNKDYVLALDTPEFRQFSGSLFMLWGHDENFFEWASGKILWVTLGLDWRPTDKLRLNANYQLNQVNRRTDGSLVNVSHIPRLKLEYQASRPIFVRLVGEFNSERQSALRDDTRTDAPILIFDPAVGDFVRTTPFTRRSFRGDILFSYQPTPGTVLFAGYGSTLRDPVDPDDPLRTGLRRSEDGFFFKMSYLFRMWTAGTGNSPPFPVPRSPFPVPRSQGMDIARRFPRHTSSRQP